MRQAVISGNKGSTKVGFARATTNFNLDRPIGRQFLWILSFLRKKVSPPRKGL
jgi:hypothetical protein